MTLRAKCIGPFRAEARIGSVSAHLAQAEDWPDNVNAHIVGFVSNMDEWMAACDVIVTKAGPGTIAEATTRALPVMLSSFLPGQEKAGHLGSARNAARRVRYGWYTCGTYGGSTLLLCPVIKNVV